MLAIVLSPRKAYVTDDANETPSRDQGVQDPPPDSVECIEKSFVIDDVAELARSLPIPF
jgi:hypothetical protein